MFAFKKYNTSGIVTDIRSKRFIFPFSCSLFGNHILMFHMHQSIMNRFGTMTPILLGSDALLVLLLVILLHVLSDNKVMCLIQWHMKHWSFQRTKIKLCKQFIRADNKRLEHYNTNALKLPNFGRDLALEGASYSFDG